MLLRQLTFTPVCVLILISMCGCGGTSTEPVTGVVTMDGKPLEGVNVIFSPADGDRRNSVGTTDANGAYSLDYTQRDVGAIVGHYKVLVSKTIMTEEGEQETLPRQYNQETTFAAEVTSSGDNTFNYDLTSQ